MRTDIPKANDEMICIEVFAPGQAPEYGSHVRSTHVLVSEVFTEDQTRDKKAYIRFGCNRGNGYQRMHCPADMVGMPDRDASLGGGVIARFLLWPEDFDGLVGAAKQIARYAAGSAEQKWIDLSAQFVKQIDFVPALVEKASLSQDPPVSSADFGFKTPGEAARPQAGDLGYSPTSSQAHAAIMTVRQFATLESIPASTVMQDALKVLLAAFGAPGWTGAVEGVCPPFGVVAEQSEGTIQHLQDMVARGNNVIAILQAFVQQVAGEDRQFAEQAKHTLRGAERAAQGLPFEEQPS
jgi:hypothetical protein